MVEDSPVLTADMIAALRCPVCRSRLRGGAQDASLRCETGHTFDVARQGYAHLGTGRRLPSGDTAEMIEARERVLAAGLFRPLSDRLAQMVPTSARLIVDLGGGTGHYLAEVLRRRPGAQGVVFDVSKAALRRAARRAGAVLADTWDRLPLADASVDAVLNVFAPRNGPEMRRVLAPGGRLVVATPAAEHLAELRDALGLLDVDAAKPERLRQTLRDFEQTAGDRLEWRLDLDEELAGRLIAMGPNAFHGHRRGVPMRVTAAVDVTTWTGRPLPSRRADRGAGR